MNKDLAGKAVGARTITDSDILSTERETNKVGQVILPWSVSDFQRYAFHLQYLFPEQFGSCTH